MSLGGDRERMLRSYEWKQSKARSMNSQLKSGWTVTDTAKSIFKLINISLINYIHFKDCIFQNQINFSRINLPIAIALAMRLL